MLWGAGQANVTHAIASQKGRRPTTTRRIPQQSPVNPAHAPVAHESRLTRQAIRQGQGKLRALQLHVASALGPEARDRPLQRHGRMRGGRLVRAADRLRCTRLPERRHGGRSVPQAADLRVIKQDPHGRHSLAPALGGHHVDGVHRTQGPVHQAVVGVDVATQHNTRADRQGHVRMQAAALVGRGRNVARLDGLPRRTPVWQQLRVGAQDVVDAGARASPHEGGFVAHFALLILGIDVRRGGKVGGVDAHADHAGRSHARSEARAQHVHGRLHIGLDAAGAQRVEVSGPRHVTTLPLVDNEVVGVGITGPQPGPRSRLESKAGHDGAAADGRQLEEIPKEDDVQAAIWTVPHPRGLATTLAQKGRCKQRAAQARHMQASYEHTTSRHARAWERGAWHVRDT